MANDVVTTVSSSAERWAASFDLDVGRLVARRLQLAKRGVDRLVPPVERTLRPRQPSTMAVNIRSQPRVVNDQVIVPGRYELCDGAVGLFRPEDRLVTRDEPLDRGSMRRSVRSIGFRIGIGIGDGRGTRQGTIDLGEAKLRHLIGHFIEDASPGEPSPADRLSVPVHLRHSNRSCHPHKKDEQDQAGNIGHKPLTNRDLVPHRHKPRIVDETVLNVLGFP